MRTLSLLLLPLLATPVLAQAPWDDGGDDGWGDAPSVEVHGLVETAVGGRIVQQSLYRNELLLGEVRGRLELGYAGERAEGRLKVDLVPDLVAAGVGVDVREALLIWRAADWLDVRAGRQTLTWGTGDLVFLNDLIPKDYVSFFIGRDDEFLKAPSNALRLGFWAGDTAIDVVWMPVWEPDLYVTGQRLAWYDPTTAAVVATPFSAPAPSLRWRNGAGALRIARSFSGVELALYGYAGFDGQPLAFDPAVGVPLHPRLVAPGASVRAPLFGGLVYGETVALLYTQDLDGNDPFVPNSRVKLLGGVERELWPKMTSGLQVLWTRLLQYDALRAAQPAGMVVPDQDQVWLTLRLRQQLLQDRLTLGLFAFVSPTDADAYIRPTISWQPVDAVALAVGANVFSGKNDWTMFGQLENNTNMYARVRYSF